MNYSLSQYFDLPDIPPNSSRSRDLIIEEINYLIQNDFDKLIYILYRVDVNENKIKKALALIGADNNAAEIIYNFLEEREIEKAQSRELFRNHNDNEEPEW